MYTDYDDLVAQTTAKINEYRKQKFRVRLFRKVNGVKIPISRENVRVVQKSRDMLFGVNLGGLNAPGVNDYITKVFNYVTVTQLLWKLIETSEDVYDFRYVRSVIEWALARDMKPTGPMIYNLEILCPDWKFPPSPEQERIWIKKLIDELGDIIKMWTVVNEPLHVPPTDSASPYFWTNAYAPDALKIVNEFGFGSTEFEAFFNVLKAAQQGGVPFDVVGLQAHCPDNGIIPLQDIENDLNMFDALGLPIHITEITMFSDGRPITYPKSDEFTHWTEEAQSREMDKLYRILFAHPSVKAITNWAPIDGDPWRSTTGLLRNDGSRKPSADMLEALITEEWTTDETAKTNKNGYRWFTGFTGEYDVYYQNRVVGNITVGDGQTNKKGFRIK